MPQLQPREPLMDHLKSALQFLTLLPLGKSETFDTKAMIPYFPLVGIIVGVLISIFDKIALFFGPFRPLLQWMWCFLPH